METLSSGSSEPVAAAAPVGTLTHALSNWPDREVAAGLHPQILAAFIGTYGAMLLSLWLIFGTELNALIVLVVCTVTFSVYFGMPIAMNRMARSAAAQPAPGSLGRFLDGDVDTYTGPVSSWGAIAQLMTIPVGLTCAFIVIGVIMRFGA